MTKGTVIRMLSDRKKKILCAVVDSYIDSANPISSKEICEKYLADCSSATVRNELSALESMGFLIQPHVSAGRIPSERAFRYYVNQLMCEDLLSEADVSSIDKVFGRSHTLDELLGQLSEVVADLTDYTSVIVKEDMSDTITAIRLVDLYNGKLLLVAVTDSRVLKDGIVDLPEGFDEQMIAEAEHWLNRIFVGKHVSEFVNYSYPFALANGRMGQYNALFKTMVDVLKKVSLQNGMDVTMSGQNNIFRHTEYAENSAKAQEFLDELCQKDKIAELFTNDGGRNGSVTVKIGKNDHVIDGCSVVTTRVALGDNLSGSIGVIGPVRMDYKKVLGVLEHVGKILTEIVGDKTYNE